MQYHSRINLEPSKRSGVGDQQMQMSIPFFFLRRNKRQHWFELVFFLLLVTLNGRRVFGISMPSSCSTWIEQYVFADSHQLRLSVAKHEIHDTSTRASAVETRRTVSEPRDRKIQLYNSNCRWCDKPRSKIKAKHCLKWFFMWYQIDCNASIWKSPNTFYHCTDWFSIWLKLECRLGCRCSMDRHTHTHTLVPTI